MSFPGSFRNKVILAIVLMLSVVMFVSWSIPPSGNMFAETLYAKDTVPRSCDKKMAELDKALAHLEKTKEQLKEKSIEKEINLALKDIDAKRVREDVDKVIKESADLVLQNINAEKIKQQIEAAIARVDIEKITRRVKLAVADLQPQIERSLEEARDQIEKARDELEKAKQELRSRDI